MWCNNSIMIRINNQVNLTSQRLPIQWVSQTIEHVATIHEQLTIGNLHNNLWFDILIMNIFHNKAIWQVNDYQSNDCYKRHVNTGNPNHHQSAMNNWWFAIYDLTDQCNHSTWPHDNMSFNKSMIIHLAI